MAFRLYQHLIILPLILSSALLHAAPRECEEVLLGPRFLHGKYTQLFRSSGWKEPLKKRKAKESPSHSPNKKFLHGLLNLIDSNLKNATIPRPLSKSKNGFVAITLPHLQRYPIASFNFRYASRVSSDTGTFSSMNL